MSNRFARLFVRPEKVSAPLDLRRRGTGMLSTAIEGSKGMRQEGEVRYERAALCFCGARHRVVGGNTSESTITVLYGGSAVRTCVRPCETCVGDRARSVPVGRRD